MPSLVDNLSKDPWVHIGGLIAIAVGLTGDRYFNLGLGHDATLMFILGGLLAMGVKIINGTAAAINNTTINEASQRAQLVLDTATQTAMALAKATLDAYTKQMQITPSDSLKNLVPTPVLVVPPHVPPIV